MSSLSHYYSKAKGGLMNINPHEAVQLGEDLAIAGGTGAILGAMAAATGGMDKQILGMTVPMDGLASLGLAVAGLSIRSPELKVASIAAGGSAASRTFERLFKKTFAHGDFDAENIPFGYGEDPAQLEAGYGYGYGQDRLVEAAAAL
jgi:hypothetical protein